MPDQDAESPRGEPTDEPAQQREADFADWCDRLSALPADFEPELNHNLTPDIELQPLRWIALGFDLLQSPKVSFFDSVLPYPIFQMGTEIFLKGMWLCQFDECRLLGYDSHIDVTMRINFCGRLKKELGHDLLRITAALRRVFPYQNDPATLRFLTIVENVIRKFYYPLYQGDKRDPQWANCRYPKRFYNDVTHQGCADAWKVYPRQWLIGELFGRMRRDLDRFWDFPLA